MRRRTTVISRGHNTTQHCGCVTGQRTALVTFPPTRVELNAAEIIMLLFFHEHFSGLLLVFSHLRAENWGEGKLWKLIQIKTKNDMFWFTWTNWTQGCFFSYFQKQFQKNTLYNIPLFIYHKFKKQKKTSFKASKNDKGQRGDSEDPVGVWRHHWDVSSCNGFILGQSLPVTAQRKNNDRLLVSQCSRNKLCLIVTTASLSESICSTCWLSAATHYRLLSPLRYLGPSRCPACPYCWTRHPITL